LTESNGLATGSARSVKDFDLYEAIGACSDLLESYGGHMYAAGLTLKIDHVSEFSRRFEEIVTRSLAGQPQVQTIDADARIALHEISPRFFRILKQFEPFGPHNTMPVFITEDVIDSGSSRLVGKNTEHIKLDLVEPDDSSAVYPGIAFNMSEKFPLIKSGMPFDICYSIAINEFRGKTNLQLYIRDIRTKDM
jgi:single-stranded-DNA-specific exonuclease